MPRSKRFVMLFGYLCIFFISAGIGLRSIFPWLPIIGFIFGIVALILAGYFKEKFEQKEHQKY